MLAPLLESIKDFFVTGIYSLLIVIAILRASLTRLLLDLKAKGWLTYLRYLPPARIWLLGSAFLLAIQMRRRFIKQRRPEGAPVPSSDDARLADPEHALASGSAKNSTRTNSNQVQRKRT
ncbi:hypothetical protein CC2G_003377 [Coprinopsis cinerea AmutBmut pab1-1]|nr:hypothetical protein CC2G_003377 [Coprinopsis cinerea AmutBmut pab1-1]